MTEPITPKESAPKRKMLWLVYLALGLAGLLLVGTEYGWPHISKWTARVGLALVYSAFALAISNGRKVGSIAAGIIWIAAIACWFV
ncbi:MAG: hypothetical protein P1R58_07365 [bacterium]|nr:hypothetical protein [bacterium]